MQHIEAGKLYSDSEYRFEYVSKFMDLDKYRLSAEDFKAIEAVADKIRPLVPVVIDAVYAKLFEFDTTKKHFVPKNEGFDGVAPTSLENLTLDHPQIKYREDFLTKCLNKIPTGPYDGRFLKYLDWVSKIHTNTPQKKPKINVDYIHINALMGDVEYILAGGILSLSLDCETEAKALLAFNKLLWIQNDYFAKYYCSSEHVHDFDLKASSTSLRQLISPSTLLPLAVGVIAGALGV